MVVSGKVKGVVRVCAIGVNYDLVGVIMPDSFNCEPVAGSIEFGTEYRLSDDPFSSESVFYKTTVAKAETDLLWTVTDRTPEGEFVNEYQTETAGATFFCGHADL